MDLGLQHKRSAVYGLARQSSTRFPILPVVSSVHVRFRRFEGGVIHHKTIIKVVLPLKISWLTFVRLYHLYHRFL